MTDRPLAASILVIGDEILGGFVHDTNSGWMAERLQEHGVELSRVIVVPDDIDDIREELQRELRRSRPRLVITSGGIGSTPDDLTYEAVAAALDRPLVTAPEIAWRIDLSVEWTRRHGLEVGDDFVEHMMRMARVPEGTLLLVPGGGWAPGVQLDLDGGIDRAHGATVLILPGVPSQFRAIVRKAVEPRLLAGRGDDLAVAELEHGFPESVLNPCFARLGERFPDVKVGSYPGWPMRIRLRGRPEEVAAARAEVETYVRELEQGPAGARLQAAWEERVRASERNA